MDERQRVTSGGRRATDLTPERVGAVRFRIQYLRAHSYEVAIAVAAIVTAMVFFIQPDALQDSVLGVEGGVMAYVWAGTYFAGGVGVTSAVLFAPHPGAWRLEVAGLMLLASAGVVYALVVCTARGLPGLPSTTIYLAITVGSLVRAHVVVALVGAIAPRAGS